MNESEVHKSIAILYFLLFCMLCEFRNFCVYRRNSDNRIPVLFPVFFSVSLFHENL